MKNIQVREGPDAAGARVWVPGLVERTGDIGGHLQQPQRTSQPSASVFICSGNYHIKIFSIKNDNCSIFRLIMAVFSMIMTEMEHIKLWEDVSLNLETKIMKH